MVLLVILLVHTFFLHSDMYLHYTRNILTSDYISTLPVKNSLQLDIELVKVGI